MLPVPGSTYHKRNSGYRCCRWGRELLAALADHDVEGDLVRVADHDVRFGVSVDEGAGDEWPALREKVLAADILIVSTPIWMGQPASVCKMVLERLDAELSEKDDEGRPLIYGKVAPKPDTTGATTKTAAANVAHLARLLRDEQYIST